MQLAIPQLALILKRLALSVIVVSAINLRSFSARFVESRGEESCSNMPESSPPILAQKSDLRIFHCRICATFFNVSSPTV